MTMTETSLIFDREEYLHPPKGGHAACPGCGAILAMRYFLKALGKNVVLLIPPGCGSVIVHNPECSLEYSPECPLGCPPVCPPRVPARIRAWKTIAEQGGIA